jgi:RimJ/RimL family protein N-acetyltransferase
MYGPVLRGKLVVLRPPRMEEAAEAARWFDDIEVTFGLLFRNPPSLEEEQRWIRDQAADRSTVVWFIEHEGRAVGSLALVQIDWVDLHAKTGTMIADKSLWGKGLATEAMQLRTRYAFTQLPLRKLHSSYFAGNEGSWKAQQRSGYREVGRLREHRFRDGAWVDEIITEVLRSDWERMQQ